MQQKLKICGLKFENNIRSLIPLEPDFMGFIFYKPSPRFAGEILNPDFLWEIPKSIKKVGVFVNEPILNILDYVARFNLDLVQLHGKEPVGLCKELQKYLPVIKAFQVDDSFQFSSTLPYQNYCTYFLFDTASENHGGSGKQFNHKMLDKLECPLPYFLSGGIDLPAIENLKNKGAYCFDVNSKFETAAGVKNIEEIIKAKQLIQT